MSRLINDLKYAAREQPMYWASLSRCCTKASSSSRVRVLRPGGSGQVGMSWVGLGLQSSRCRTGCKALRCRSHATNAPLHDDADHCPDQVVDAMRSRSRQARPLVCTGPIEDCRWFQLGKAQGGSKRGGGVVLIRTDTPCLYASTLGTSQEFTL
jgi:hypothetical protein